MDLQFAYQAGAIRIERIHARSTADAHRQEETGQPEFTRPELKTANRAAQEAEGNSQELKGATDEKRFFCDYDVHKGDQN
ncbi:unnamed protein product [Schistocephalus solidus]|uniref:Uncharacterized protein n=1 Tax=Schistocephalus solidus TaxID=70667 RepID=A0A183TLC2_SCHSO|nr:unnamed protein product [Schistocephalus solidus]